MKHQHTWKNEQMGAYQRFYFLTFSIINISNFFFKMTVWIEKNIFLVFFGTNHHFITYILIPESMRKKEEINSMTLPLCLNHANYMGVFQLYPKYPHVNIWGISICGIVTIKVIVTLLYSHIESANNNGRGKRRREVLSSFHLFSKFVYLNIKFQNCCV